VIILSDISGGIKALNIPSRLKYIRKAKGLTQKQLASQAGISFSMLSKIESGERDNPSLETLQKIVAVLDMTLDDLLGNNSLHDSIIKNDIDFLDNFFKTCDHEASNAALDMLDSLRILLNDYPSELTTIELLQTQSYLFTMIKTMCTHLENVCYKNYLLSDNKDAYELVSEFIEYRGLINDLLDEILKYYLSKLNGTQKNNIDTYDS
jgi:transcriptional regulator with XRE-family HTH domain